MTGAAMAWIGAPIAFGSVVKKPNSSFVVSSSLTLPKHFQRTQKPIERRDAPQRQFFGASLSLSGLALLSAAAGLSPVCPPSAAGASTAAGGAAGVEAAMMRV
jgi:hypothetical protein